MTKAYHVMSDGTLLIKAPVQALKAELGNQTITVHEALDFFILAEEFFSSKQNAAAGEAYEKSLKSFPSMSAYLNWGNISFISGKYIEAHQGYLNGLTLAEKSESRWFKSAFLSNIGHLYYSEGDSDEAIKFFKQALPVIKEAGENKTVTTIVLGILLKMEDIYNQKKELNLAIECLQQALVLFKKSGGKKGAAKCLNNLGLMLVSRKDYDQAVNCFEEALDMFRELGSHVDEAEQLGNLGSVYRDICKNDLALKYYRESLTVFKEIGHELGIANELGNIGYILFKKGDFNSTLDCFRRAEKLYLKLGLTSRAEATKKNIKSLLEKIM